MTAPKHMTLKVSMESFPRIKAFVKSFADHACLNDNETRELRLVVEETVGNIIDHSGASELTIDVNASDGHLNVTISDDGQVSDSKQITKNSVSEPDFEIPPHERPIGGLGIVFIKNISKNFTYHRVDNRNILEIQLNKDAI